MIRVLRWDEMDGWATVGWLYCDDGVMDEDVVCVDVKG